METSEKEKKVTFASSAKFKISSLIDALKQPTLNLKNILIIDSGIEIGRSLQTLEIIINEKLSKEEIKKLKIIKTIEEKIENEFPEKEVISFSDLVSLINEIEGY